MRVGMILDKPFPPDARVEREATALIDSGNEVFMYSMVFDGRVSDNRTFTYRGIKIHEYHFSKLTFKLSALSQTFPFYRMLISSSLMDYIKSTKPNVIHVHDMVNISSILNIRRKLFSEIKVVLDLHEDRPSIMRSYGGFKSPLKRFLVNPDLWDKNQGKYIEESDYCIVVTEEAKDRMCKRYNFSTPISVVGNFIEKPVSVNRSNELRLRFSNTFNLLYFGDTGLRRGTGFIIKAMKELINSINSIRLIIIGSSSDDAYLKKIIDEFNLQKHVFLEGYKNHEELYQYAYESDVCLSPLERNPHHDTTHANKLFQYMFAEKPQIVSDCPAQAEIVTKTNSGLVYRAGDIRDFCEKVNILYSDNDLRNRLSENGKKAVSEVYNWSTQNKGLVNLYKNIHI